MTVHRLARPDDNYLCYHHTPGKENVPGVLFLGGFQSDMSGTKATALEKYAQQNHVPFTRFDYYGHGLSSGDFQKGTISRWLDDSLAIVDQCKPEILIGSSMGAWIALLVAKIRPQIKTIITIAAAADFTEDLIWQKFTTTMKEELLQKNIYYLASDYDEKPQPITLQLIEDGRKHLLLRKPLALSVAIHLIHGMKDKDVPWQTSLKLLETISNPNVKLTLIKGGDHRLAKPQHLDLLFSILSAFIKP